MKKLLLGWIWAVILFPSVFASDGHSTQTTLRTTVSTVAPVVEPGRRVDEGSANSKLQLAGMNLRAEFVLTLKVEALEATLNGSMNPKCFPSYGHLLLSDAVFIKLHHW